MAFLWRRKKQDKSSNDNSEKNDSSQSNSGDQDDARPEKIIFPKTDTYIIIPTVINPKELEEFHEALEELVGHYLNL